MKLIETKIYLLVIIMMGIALNLSAQEFQTTKSGSWSETEVWSQKNEGCNCWIPLNKMNITISSLFDSSIRINKNDTIIITQEEVVKLYGRMTYIIIEGVLVIDGTLDLTSIGSGFVKIVLDGGMIANGNVSLSQIGNSNCLITGNGRIDMGLESDFKWHGKEIHPNDFPNLAMVMDENDDFIYSSQPKTIENQNLKDYPDTESNDTLFASVETPIIVDDEILVDAGIDIELNNIHSLVTDVSLVDRDTTVVLSNDLHIASHINKELTGKPNDGLTSTKISHSQHAIHTAPYHIYEDASANLPLLRSFVPVSISVNDKISSVMPEVPSKENTASSGQLLILILLIGITSLLVVSSVIVLVMRTSTKPILGINGILDEVANSKLNGAVNFNIPNDNAAQIALEMKKLLAGMRNTANTAPKVCERNYDKEYSKVSQ
jgi:hypothetical protein